VPDGEAIAVEEECQYTYRGDPMSIETLERTLAEIDQASEEEVSEANLDRIDRIINRHNSDQAV